MRNGSETDAPSSGPVHWGNWRSGDVLRPPEPIGLSRIQDQVHVVWHQAVSPDFHIRLARLFPKKIAVNLLIAVFKENRFSTIATLRHVMRETGYHHAGQTRHGWKITTNQNRGE
jgi:hypothetical protein